MRSFLLAACSHSQFVNKHGKNNMGWEPWSSGHGRRFMFKRSWFQIPAPWPFLNIICCKKCNVCLKNENKLKRADVAHFKRKKKNPKRGQCGH